jgi:hypothetical protein
MFHPKKKMRKIVKILFLTCYTMIFHSSSCYKNYMFSTSKHLDFCERVVKTRNENVLKGFNNTFSYSFSFPFLFHSCIQLRTEKLFLNPFWCMSDTLMYICALKQTILYLISGVKRMNLKPNHQ